ncbi:hypothetical protein [Xenorhabdus budapestensis]|uniref:Uncharacterized protein n=1 Tax=Xenorhabdus budapestensis TaxID=290110 RepID=A0A2D0IL53_XENBU|nr:hypothetical protein [Xenorhabdus budapestensis]PHM22513.1 hypothetical protein Xbud_03749 [Xenorhabdus budapestensis]
MIKSFDLSVLESVAKTLGDTCEGFTGSQIGLLLAEQNFPDPLIGGTKWKRLYQAFVEKQSNDSCANNIGAFIEHVMSPARHYDKQEWYLWEPLKTLNTKNKINFALTNK